MRRHSILTCFLVVFAAGCVHGEDRPDLAYVLDRTEAPTVLVAIKEDGKELWSISLGESAVRGSPSWSPDGKRLAVVRYRGPIESQTPEIVVVDADGSNERVLGEGANPSWTHDSRSLVVDRPGATPEPATIHVLSADGDGGRLLTTGSQPAVSHGGSAVAFIRNVYKTRADGGCCEFSSSSLHTISLDGTGLRRIARIARPVTHFIRPVWLPDDSGVAVLASTGTAGGPISTYSLSGQRRVIARGVGSGTFAPGRGENYAWSPSGDLVAYSREGRLYIVRSDGTEVAAFGESDATDVEWSPDGEKVAFSKLEVLETGQFNGLYLIDVETKERSRFAIAYGDLAFLDWRP